MKTLPVGEFKTHFSEVLNEVKTGAEIVITYGRKKENIAVIIPYENFKNRNRVTLGLLKDKQMKINDDFDMTAEELLHI
ncbi:MAG: type II toxin-antitoxin system Phd/YefM family antitoxin [Spirochaetes bacterium]|nr:MAG: type II toxin-antitoxin system Phd/YefM family antitoxin [Spirochaetota bacterium]